MHVMCVCVCVLIRLTSVPLRTHTLKTYHAAVLFLGLLLWIPYIRELQGLNFPVLSWP